MQAILGIPGDYLLFSATGLVGMVVGSGIVNWMTKNVKLTKKKVLGISIGGIVGFLAGSGVGWWVYEMWR
jgi:hypothetical protein